MSSELMWKEIGVVEVAVGSYVRCRDNKRGRNPAPTSARLGVIFQRASDLNVYKKPPEQLRLAASPWEEKSTQDQQRKTEQELGAVHGWIWRELSDEKGRSKIAS